jgi:class 3 adenylate cyclase
MTTVDDYQHTAARLLKQGAPLVAYDTIAEGLRKFPSDTRLRQLLALALARTGATREANRRLHTLVAEGHTDEETVGMLARTYKDLWIAEKEPDRRRQNLEQAQHWYAEAYRLSGGYWSGINAATMAQIRGDLEQSRALARRVADLCVDRLHQASDQEQYWILATLGEAALLVGDVGQAEEWYRLATTIGGVGIGDLVSTRRNARLILRQAQQDTAVIDACFRIPRVAVFAGHLIDRPDRPLPRFPPQLEPRVRDALAQHLQQHDIGSGYASAGNGGDILFLELLRDAGAACHVVLPYNREQFLQDSVDFPAGSTWAERYRSLLDTAAEVVTASDQRMLGGAMSYEYGFLLLDGMAAIRAEELETDLVCVALWDGRDGDGPGGTAASVAHWRKAGRHIDIIDLRALSEGVQPAPIIVVPPDPAASACAVRPENFDAQLVGLLFADVAGFSKLTEEQIPQFVERYLGRVASVLAAAPEQPLLANTWGDGLYFVFRDVRQTGCFALRLSEALHATDWTEYGLPGALALRIAVHAGPAYACTDPVTARPNYLGAHVALAARIEPVTPSGVVYGSGAFAALAKANDVTEFSCTYVGRTPLAKGYGTFPMYVLHAPRD